MKPKAIKNKKIITLSLLALAAIAPVTLAVSCGEKSDDGVAPKQGQVVDLTSASEGTFHGIFRNGSRQMLPVADVTFEVTVSGTKLSYKWTEVDRAAKIPTDYVNDRVPYSHILAYLSTKLAGTTKTPAEVYRTIVGSSSFHGINPFPTITV